MELLSKSTIPEYLLSSYRYFKEEECHVTRVCKENVLIIMFSGVLRFSENGEEREIYPFEYYIQKKGLLQRGDIKSSSPVYYYVHFNGDFCENEQNGIKIRGKFSEDKLVPLIEKLESVKYDIGNNFEKTAALLNILLALGEERKKDTSLAFKIKDHIEKNISGELSLEELGATFGYCKNYILRLFKNKYGITVGEYITERRLELSREMLLSSTLSMNEIADLSGFNNYVNFYKAFVKKEKMSPGEYRAIHSAD